MPAEPFPGAAHFPTGTLLGLAEDQKMRVSSSSDSQERDRRNLETVISTEQEESKQPRVEPAQGEFDEKSNSDHRGEEDYSEDYSENYRLSEMFGGTCSLFWKEPSNRSMESFGSKSWRSSPHFERAGEEEDDKEKERRIDESSTS